MDNLYGRYKPYFFIGLGVIVALGAWWGLSGEPSSDTLVTESASSMSPTEKSLVDTLLQLRAVSLSDTIFSDPSFQVLRDFGTQIVPEPVGRENPFAPLSAGAGGATSTSPSPASRPPVSPPSRSPPVTPPAAPVD